MITVDVYPKDKEPFSKEFDDVSKALRFMYAMKHKGYIVNYASWDSDEVEYLYRRFKN